LLGAPSFYTSRIGKFFHDLDRRNANNYAEGLRFLALSGKIPGEPKLALDASVHESQYDVVAIDSAGASATMLTLIATLGGSTPSLCAIS